MDDKVKKPTLAFATMCKNEEHVIGSVLNAVAPYIDYLVVADNGSTDRTLEIVRDFMTRTGIPGEIHQDKWYGFDVNKNMMMSYVFDKTDYVLHLDADDLLAGDFSFVASDAGFDAYYMTLKRGSLSWKATTIYSNRLHWRFCGTAHTVIKCQERPNFSIGDLSDRGFIIADGVGSRAFDPNKYFYDAQRLEKQFWDTLVSDPEGLNYRSVFYCAQSFMDHASINSDLSAATKALQWYRLFTRLSDTWTEERFEAQMRVARCLMMLNHPVHDVIAEMKKAIDIFPDRAEPLFHLGKYCNQKGDHASAYGFLSLAKTLSLEAAKRKYVLFVIESCYDKFVNDELSVACYWLAKKDEGLKLLLEIIDDPDFAEQKPRLDKNLNYLQNLADLAV